MVFQLTWFHYTILATIFNGIQGFLYKNAAEKGVDKCLLFFSSATTTYLLAAIIYFVNRPSINMKELGTLFTLSILIALGALFAMLLRFMALQHVSSNIVFSIVKSSHILVVIVIGYFLFQEKIILSYKLLVGICLILLSLFLLMMESKDQYQKAPVKKIGLLFTLLTIFISAGLYPLYKFAVDIKGINTNAFILIINLQMAIFALALGIFKRKEIRNPLLSIKTGAFIGIYSYLSFFCLLLALSDGYISIIVPMYQTSLVITILLSAHFLKEYLNVRIILGILLSLAGIFLFYNRSGF